jgi:hypothetical protein
MKETGSDGCKRRFKQVLCSTLLGLLCAAVVKTQEAHQHQHELGKVNFTISCSVSAQKQFNRAVAWLHSFEYEEAEKAFTDVAVTDPRCGMAHWGIAMSNYHPIWGPPSVAELKKGLNAIEKAKSVGARTERELHRGDRVFLQRLRQAGPSDARISLRRSHGASLSPLPVR